MAKTYIVQEGDTLASIALEEGFYTWETIYNHPQNEALRAQRPNPGELFVGDVIYIPDKQLKAVELKAFRLEDNPHGKYTFVRKSLPVHIALYLQDEDDEPYRNKKYQLNVDGQIYAGATTVDGLLKEKIPPKSRLCVITLWPNGDDPNEVVTWSVHLGAIVPSAAT